MDETIMTSQKLILGKFAVHDDGGIVFTQEYDPDMPDAYRESIKISPEIFTDLGEPEVITITVEPGDKLNEGE